MFRSFYASVESEEGHARWFLPPVPALRLYEVLMAATRVLRFRRLGSGHRSQTWMLASSNRP